MNHLLGSAAVAAVAPAQADRLSQTQKNEKALLRPAADKVGPLGVRYEGGVGEARDNVPPKGPKQAAPAYDRNFADIAAHDPNVKPFCCLTGPGPVREFAEVVHPDMTAFDRYPSVPQTLHLSLQITVAKVLRLPDNKVIASERKGEMLTWREAFASGDGALYVVE